MLMSTADIPTFLAYARSEYLYSLKEGFGYFTPVAVFAVSSHANESLKISLMADDITMFSNVSINSLSNSKTAPKLEEDDCVFEPCSDDNISITSYDYLSSIETCGIWKKDGGFWQHGIYLFTIEWDKTKQQLHFLEAEDGNYILWANTNITWGDEIPEKLPSY